MTLRRSFLKKLAGASGALSLSPFMTKVLAEDVKDALVHLNRLSPEDAAQDEELWHRIQQAYTVSPNIINLNNGGVSPQPKIVQDAVDRYYHYSNEAPSYYMWRILDQGRESLRMKLADVAHCSPEEVAINRNATEALDTIIFGMDLQKGDEVLLCKYDYPNMFNAWKTRAKRTGIKLNWITLDLAMEDEDAIVQRYLDGLTPKTKVAHITQLINWSGQIVPAGKICAEMKKRGIKTIVDGAHAFAHIDSDLTAMDCDYFGTSLHKWLCAPFGTGMIHVKKENIADLWPLIPDHEPERDDIRKFESLGTRSFAPEQAIGQAIDFHNAIGAERKRARLHYLKRYWADKVKNHPQVRINTPLSAEFSCALCNVGIEGMEAGDVNNRLFKEYKIHATPVKWEAINGVRITPHVYTKLSDLDRLEKALLTFADEQSKQSMKMN
ncbi:selenocysteine lyase/cysteine desulfurase [Catalinimonas alkaloidigena]|uniref:aminotransferase class V-fold PLP-dependent enzyme n=1 Tax=Catalinimonas alkaloidigena TaxID=1075417 RepID=UPI002404FD05|nr:aminotransferase class V-fold PLP-dependent enzyme [Catalinimonas alkaloidigena]MDF9794874.1 selenocysteine lyase/cysteine desulfurase [Catalinimonas alkaloidigena]